MGSTFSFVRQIIAEQGIAGIYTGLGSTLVREAPSFGLYFSSYELARRQIKSYLDIEGEPRCAMLHPYRYLPHALAYSSLFSPAPNLCLF